jgi:exodeoxyribonuclease VII large subunit
LADFVSDLRAPTPTAAAELSTPSKDNLIETVLGYQRGLQIYIQKYLEQQKTSLLHLDERLMVHSPVSLIQQLKERYTQTSERLSKAMDQQLTHKKNQTQLLSQRITAFDIIALVKYKKEKNAHLTKELESHFERILTKKDDHFQRLIQALKHQNPLTLMDKGYTFTTKNQKRIESIDDVNINDTIETTLKDGKLTSVVKHKETHTWK